MSRHVRTLHLTAPTAPLARRGAFLVEDALRTASLAGEQRLVLIRRLDVGKIDPRRPPATVALAIERAWQQMAGQWSYADSPAAATADIVWFRDALEPFILFAHRVALGKRPSGWFWRKAIPAEVMEDATPLRRLLFTVIEQQGLLATAAFIGELHRRNALLPLLEQLHSTDGTLLWSFYPTAPDAPLSLPFPLTPYSLPLTSLPAWHPDDPRTLWLAATLLIHEKPARLVAPYLRPMAEEMARRMMGALVAGNPVLEQVQSEGDAETRKAESGKRKNDLPTEKVESTPLPVQDEGKVVAESAPEGVYSEYAGLFLLLNVLNAVGMGKWCATMPELIEADFPTLLLRHLVGLTSPASPPLRDGEGGWGGEVAFPPFSFLLSLFTILVRRWLARHLHADLATVIQRPGRLVWTRTHLDVVFDHRQVDLALRMAGLDIDPGWVPWWGRVVKFHYEER